jgi:hypothetical protein
VEECPQSYSSQQAAQGAAAVTVTSAEVLAFTSTALVAVMITVPTALARTQPMESTVASAGVDVTQTARLSFDPISVTTKRVESPTAIVALRGVTRRLGPSSATNRSPEHALATAQTSGVTRHARRWNSAIRESLKARP